MEENYSARTIPLHFNLNRTQLMIGKVTLIPSRGRPGSLLLAF